MRPLPVRQNRISARDVSAICERIARHALSSPQTHFTVRDILTDQLLLECRPSESIRGIFAQVIDPELALSMAHFSFSDEDCCIEGLLSPLNSGVASKDLQYMFFNGRFAVCPVLSDYLNRICGACFRFVRNPDDWTSHRNSPGTKGRRRHPAFVILIKAPHDRFLWLNAESQSQVEVQNESRMLQALQDILKRVVSASCPALECYFDRIFPQILDPQHATSFRTFHTTYNALNM